MQFQRVPSPPPAAGAAGAAGAERWVKSDGEREINETAVCVDCGGPFNDLGAISHCQRLFVPLTWHFFFVDMNLQLFHLSTIVEILTWEIARLSLIDNTQVLTGTLGHWSDTFMEFEFRV